MAAGLAAVSASIVVPGALTQVTDPHPDAVLLELGRQLRLKTQELSAWHDLYVEPVYETPPEVLRYSDQDREFGFPESNDKRWPGFHAPWPPPTLESASVERLRMIPLADYLAGQNLEELTDVLVIKKGNVAKMEVWPEADERRRQIAEAAAAYRAAHKASPQEVAESERELKTDALFREQWDIVYQITTETAHTLDGLAVKALAVQMVDDPDSEVKLGEYPFDELVSSALNGLIALSKPV